MATFQYVRAIVRSALGYAVEKGARDVSPITQIPRQSRPRVSKRKEMQTWSVEQARTFLASVDDTMWHALFAFALDTGMRRGEVLGVKWQDIDLKAGTVSVRRNRVLVRNQPTEHTPKSNKARVIDIDEETVTVLRRLRTYQKEQRLAWGEAYVNSGYVFTMENGEARHPDAMDNRFKAFVRTSGVEPIRFHDLRHTSATLDLLAGTHPKVVQERLGHHSVAYTLDLYTHVTPSMGRDAAKRRGQLLYGS